MIRSAYVDDVFKRFFIALIWTNIDKFTQMDPVHDTLGHMTGSQIGPPTLGLRIINY